MANTIRVPKLGDSLVLQHLEKVAAVLKGEITDIQILGMKGPIRPADIPAVFDKVKASSGTTLYRATLKTENIIVQFWRRITVQDAPNAAYSSSPFFDEIEVRAESLATDKNARLFAAVAEISKLFSTADTASSAQRSEESQAFVQSTFQELREFSLQLSNQFTDARVTLEAEFRDLKKSLEAEHEERKKQLNAEVEGERTKLAQQREALDQEKKTLDDRTNTHARRGIHRELKNAIKGRYSKFELTPETKQLRRPIHVACWAGLAVLGVASVYFGHELMTLSTLANAPMTTIGFAIIRQLGLTLGFLALLAYYIRWMNRWHDKHADAEFALKQFDLDVDRASWVVETALEWRAAGGGRIPTILLQGVTRHLFEGFEARSNEEMHPADYLASALLGSASGVDLKVPGGSIKLERSGVRKLQKTPAAKKPKDSA